MLRLLESGHYRCIGCGLCEKICISNCISMDTRYDENQRKEVSEYTINFGRAGFSLFEDMLTPIDKLNLQQEYDGFGAVSPNADDNIKQTPLAY